MIKKKLLYTVYPVYKMIDEKIEQEDTLYILGDADRAKATKIFRKEHYDKLEAGMFLGSGKTKHCLCEISIERFLNSCETVKYVTEEEVIYE